MTVPMYFTTGRADPGLTKRFTAAMLRSLEYADGHPDEVRRILGTYTKIVPEVIAKIDLPRDRDQLTTRSLPRSGELRGQVYRRIQQARGAR
ncbi:hypothetical protein [Nonomuraea sp. NPDC052265]|uniref:hypothetical protein n=1 Tax=Nonomuraea sp. NPDC052265 TaxID=3364374 RepID=UPI0037CC59C5